VDTLIDEEGTNDLYRLEVVAEDENEDFNIAYIGDDFVYPHRAPFASDYMKHLFDYSYRLAARGNPWHERLPGEGVPSDVDDALPAVDAESHLNTTPAHAASALDIVASPPPSARHARLRQ
jgi:hypothetical protein